MHAKQWGSKMNEYSFVFKETQSTGERQNCEQMTA